MLVCVHQDLTASSSIPCISRIHYSTSETEVVLFCVIYLISHEQFLLLVLIQAGKTKAWLVLSGKENLAHSKYKGLILIPSLF